MADRLITDEDLVVLYCGGDGGTRLPINMVLEVDPTTFTRGTSPPLDVADIDSVAVNAF